jgi:hypothetical protein
MLSEQQSPMAQVQFIALFLNKALVTIDAKQCGTLVRGNRMRGF